MITVQIDDLEQLTIDLAQYPDRVDTAMVRALNRAILAARTAMVKEVAADTGLKSAAVKAAMIMKNATRADPSCELGAGTKRIPLIQFNAKGPEPSRGKGRGVTYKIGTSPRTAIANAFIATVGAGHRGAFVRTGKGRLPIKELAGPSLGHVFAKYRPIGLARAQDSFTTTFAHEIDLATPDGDTSVPDDTTD